ncbi:uncharacterized protein LOC130283845 [Hyla sarda]|uniref:uncharacterized protein LOC130283845 n=1 Tax=Hyla sarda TaxID=327740 RepID=UPI0024C2F538|nr:uncharacterized protein LOC130283845 [Hyla sarda]XP_056389416.1 uncharacterized protein LOC130283845 [Hyla sarda]
MMADVLASVAGFQARLDLMDTSKSSESAPSTAAPTASTSQATPTGTTRSRSNRNHGPATDGLATYSAVANALIRGSLAPSTIRAYDSALASFTTFMHNLGLSATISVHSSLAFIGFCHSSLHLSHNTIKLHLTGLQHHRSLLHPNTPSLLSARPIKAALRGVSLSSLHRSPSRTPVTGDLFRAMCTLLDTHPFGYHLSTVIKAAIHLAFYGFLRPGEFTRLEHRSPGLTLGQLSPSGSGFTLSLLATKTCRWGASVRYFPVSHRWCPVAALSALLAMLSGRAADGPLLPLGGQASTSSQFIKHVRSLITMLGKDSARISGHSFRIGAASAASRHNVPAHVIKKLGRWSSACFDRYVLDPSLEMANVFKILAL